MSFRIKTEHGIEEKKKASEVLPVLEERRETVTKVEIHPETSSPDAVTPSEAEIKSRQRTA
jgi:hypothetical protein